MWQQPKPQPEYVEKTGGKGWSIMGTAFWENHEGTKNIGEKMGTAK